MRVVRNDNVCGPRNGSSTPDDGDEIERRPTSADRAHSMPGPFYIRACIFVSDLNKFPLGRSTVSLGLHLGRRGISDLSERPTDRLLDGLTEGSPDASPPTRAAVSRRSPEAIRIRRVMRRTPIRHSSPYTVLPVRPLRWPRRVVGGRDREAISVHG